MVIIHGQLIFTRKL